MNAPTAFKFVEFNARRVARGAEGARVEVTYSDGTSDLLWMSKRDIAKNMMAFGRCPELTKAHAAYSAAPPAADERFSAPLQDEPKCNKGTPAVEGLGTGSGDRGREE